MRLLGVPTTLRRGLTVVAVLALLTLAPILPYASPDTAPAETRALWVLRTSLGSPESISALVRTARAHGFMIDPRQSSPDYIAVVGRSVFGKPAAASTGTR